VELRPATRTLVVQVDRGVDVLADVLGELRHRSLEVVEIGLRRPTLDDVFLTLTGHAAAPAGGEGDDEPTTAPRQEVPA